ncbi:MAG TPA: HD domain-containing protein [Caulobacteraceae bacterium]|jgi:hypothetical protein
MLPTQPTLCEGRDADAQIAGENRETSEVATYRRLRDPVHDLIEFEDTAFGRAAWSLIETPAFQRLRRVKQLGFSDFVYPGATHSRFAHSVGVFHTARRLGLVLELKKAAEFEPERAETAYFAALLHDLGHGPFSHAFEGALGEIDRHEKWTEEIIRSQDVSAILEGYRAGLTEDVARIFKSETLPDIYSSIVSSQFDADRLDYMRRDRLMAGTEGSRIDITWLLSNLEVCTLEVGGDDPSSFASVDTFVLGPKAGWTGEAYVVGLFHLYPTIYLHKATRGAEKLFGRMLRRVRDLVKGGTPEATGLPNNHPLIAYLNERTLGTYLGLDDATIWGAISLLAQAGDPSVKEDAIRLRDRRLLKAIDVRFELSDGRLYPGDEVAQRQLAFQRSLSDRIKADPSLVNRILIDRYERDPYKRKGYESPRAIERIHVLSKGHPVDLATMSPVVAALKPLQIFRVYVAPEDHGARELVTSLVQEASK